MESWVVSDVYRRATRNTKGKGGSTGTHLAENDSKQDKRQFERFKELNCWGTCNFFDFRLFHRDEELGDAVVVPERTLRPDQDDAAANRAISKHDAAGFLRLVEILHTGAGQEPNPRDA